MKRNSVHFFVAITALSLFILCIFFLEGKINRERESNGDKKMHGVPFHHLSDYIIQMINWFEELWCIILMLLNKLCHPLDIKIMNLILGIGKLYGKTLLLCSPRAYFFPLEIHTKFTKIDWNIYFFVWKMVKQFSFYKCFS